MFITLLYFVLFAFFLGFLYFCSVFSFSTLILLVGSFDCKTVFQITYTVLVETSKTLLSQSIYEWYYAEVHRQSESRLFSLQTVH